MVLRLLCLLVWLFPAYATAQTLDATTVARVQQALQILDYRVASADGVWRDDTSWAVAQYLFDFGLGEAATLTQPEAAALVARAAQVQRGPGLVVVDSRDWQTNYSDSSGENTSWQPVQRLFVSGRHALAAELLSRSLPYDYNRSINPTYQGWSADKKARAQTWLEGERARLAAADPTTSLFDKTLVEIDLNLLALDSKDGRKAAVDALFPALQVLVERFPDASLPDQMKPLVNQRLLFTLRTLTWAGACTDDGAFPEDRVALSLAILQRYETMQAGAPELMGVAGALIPCVDAATADRLFAWRSAVATARGDATLALDIGIAQVHHAFQRGDTDAAKRHVTRLFNAATDAQRFRLATETPMPDLGLLDAARPYILAKVDALSGTEIQSNAVAGNAMYFGIGLLKDGFGFQVVDRIFFETDNMWCDTDRCDVLFFYTLMMNIMMNSGDGEASLPFLQPLIDRALAAGNKEAAEAFSANRIEILLALGRFSEAEEEIGTFITLARQGAQDPKVATWQAKLNLVSNEGLSPGVVYAQQLSGYLDVICTLPDPQPADLPSIDRDAVYEDPAFLHEAERLDLPQRIATCNASAFKLEGLRRVGCYLWAKEGDLARLTAEMQAWLKKVEAADSNPQAIVFQTAAMGCPMGIAEAGRNDLIVQFMAQIDNNRTEDGIVILKLATLKNAEYARWVMTWSGTGRTNVYDVDFLLMEAASQQGDPVADTIRTNALGAFVLNFAGASPDTSEQAFIRAMALDQAAGYAALNLDGIALYFLNAAVPELATAPDPTQVDRMLADAEHARYALARARLALKAGDAATALGYVGPPVEAFLDRVLAGKAGSVEDLGPWARRLRGFVELYLSALAADPARLAGVAPERILAAQQLLSAADSSATSGRLAARLSASNPALVRDYQDALRDWRGALLSATSGASNPARIAAARQKVDALAQELARVDPAFGASSAQSIAMPGDLVALADSRAIVVLTSLPKTLLVTTLGAKGIDVRALPVPRADVLTAVADFRAAILQEADLDTAAARLLARSALSGLGAGAGLPDGIIFVVDGPFVALPFAALPIVLGGRQTYLGAEAALSISPSLSSLATRGTGGSSQADRPFLGIGDAIFADAAARDRLGFVPARLRETNAELRFMAVVLGADPASDLLLGPGASERAVLNLSAAGTLGRYRTIVFATHGFFDNPGRLQEAGLLLSQPEADDATRDGVLSTSEIYGLRLDADLVILSACDTGAVTNGNQGLSDLSKAFTYAGARGLIVTHWEIDTFAATEISRRLASELKTQGAGNAAALRSAIAALLNDPGAARFHHPKFWASHAVVGL